MANPYAGTAQEADWDKGFRAGLVVPDQTISAPLVLSPEARDAYDSGVRAGQFVNSSLTPVEPLESTPETVAGWVHGGVDIGGPVQAAVSEGVTQQGFWAAIKAIGPEVAFNVAVLVAVWGPKRDNFWSDIVASRLAEVRSAVAAGNGADDNLELFMAVADPTGSAGEGDDPLGANGVWHGLFRLTFQEAQADAGTYEDPTKVYIHRYQTSQPTLVDVLRP